MNAFPHFAFIVLQTTAFCIVIRIVRKNNKAYFKRDLRINKGRFNANAKKIKLMNNVIFIRKKGKWCCIKEKVSVLYF